VSSEGKDTTGSGKAGEGRSLTSQTVRGFAWAFTGTIGQALLQVVSMMVLSRLLTKNEFGMAVAAMLIVGLSQLVSQVGVGPAIVQRQALTSQQIAAAFYCSLVTSGALAISLVAGTPLLNRIVNLPSDSGLVRLLTVALVLVSISAVPMGVLQRDLRFRSMALVDFLAFGPATIGTSITLAALDCGAVSVIWGQIAGALVTAIGYHTLARIPIRPSSPVAMWRDVKPLLSFGVGYSLSQIGNWFALQSDNLVVTNMLGTQALGIYSRAYQLISQPANIIGAAMDKALFPAMARVKDDGERLRSAYVRSASLVALVTIPLSAILFALSPEVVRVMLGDQWLEVIAPLEILAVVLLPRTSYKISGSLTRATGDVYGGAWRQWLYAGEVFVGCALGVAWGIRGVAVGASGAIVLHFLVMLRFSSRVAPGLMGDVLTMYIKHVPITLVTFGAAEGTALLVRPFGSILATIVLTGVAWAAGTGAALLLLQRLFREELDVVRQLIRPGSGSGPAGTDDSSGTTETPDPRPRTTDGVDNAANGVDNAESERWKPEGNGASPSTMAKVAGARPARGSMAVGPRHRT
jgi:O-antigen/teichoic acid export membrane protein